MKSTWIADQNIISRRITKKKPNNINLTMGYINAFYLLATLAISSIASAQACTKVCLDNCSGAAWARWGPKWGCLESLPKCNMAEIRRKQKNGGRWTPCRNGRERYDLLDDEGYNAQDLVLLPNQVDSDEIDEFAIYDEDEFVDRRLRGSCGRKYWTNRGYTKGVKCTKYKFSYYGCSDSQCRYCTKNTWTLDRLSDSFRDKIKC